jgi:Tol biopolymer transport system component
MRGRYGWSLVLTLMGVAACGVYGQGNATFSMPDSVLLFSNASSELRLVTTTSVHVLKLPMPLGPLSYPTLAPDGNRVASGLLSSGTRIPRRFVLGVLSVKEQGWKTYGDFEGIGVAAFSPDGTRAAFAAEQAEKNHAFLILDIPSGKMTTVAQLASVPERAGLSWSPDGKRLTAEMQRSDEPPAIAVFDPYTEKVKILGKGVDPVWSPTGEWIAYSDETRQKCFLIHPDGTGAKVIRDLSRKLGGYRLIFYGAVWSPDGSRILLNEMKGEGPNIDVVLVDLASGKVTGKSRNGLAVLGWATEKP